jgi:(1->4)-alpha-D-glucan 1-alpha-D-glucosylmutase
MLATSTHDAKRSEDVRLRVDVISELPAAWRLAVRRWSRMNRRHQRIVDGARAPSRNDEYLLYQLLVGSLPAGLINDGALADYADRIEQVMLKSARESKAVTSWMNPNVAYEAALAAFVRALLGHRAGNLFLDDLQANAAVLAWHGALNGLTLAVVKALSPGVPDYYQGHEAIELTLVDPDNRRPIDFERRHALLESARVLAAAADRGAGLHELLTNAVDGRAKFFVTWRALQLRRVHEEGLKGADYLALEVRGERAAQAIAFARRAGSRWWVVVGTRLSAAFGLPPGTAPIGAAWGDTVLVWPDEIAAGTEFDDAISARCHAVRDGALALAELLREFPVAALFGDDRASHDEPRRAGTGAV